MDPWSPKEHIEARGYVQDLKLNLFDHWPYSELQCHDSQDLPSAIVICPHNLISWHKILNTQAQAIYSLYHGSMVTQKAY